MGFLAMLLILLLAASIGYLTIDRHDTLVDNEIETAKWIESNIDYENMTIYADRGPIYTWYLASEVDYCPSSVNISELGDYLNEQNASYYIMTPLEDNFSANFNILVAGVPRVMGVAEILSEWIAFRTECVSRRVYHDLSKAKDKLHLLLGLKKILLDIDKAIKIVRETEEEAEVVPNLMIGFGIDEIQAE